MDYILAVLIFLLTLVTPAVVLNSTTTKPPTTTQNITTTNPPPTPTPPPTTTQNITTTNPTPPPTTTQNITTTNPTPTTTQNITTTNPPTTTQTSTTTNPPPPTTTTTQEITTTNAPTTTQTSTTTKPPPPPTTTTTATQYITTTNPPTTTQTSTTTNPPTTTQVRTTTKASTTKETPTNPDPTTSVNYCARNPCQNRGTCSVPDGIQGYTCKCPRGYSGQNCQIDINECAINPCKNGGCCLDQIGKYTCQCPRRYTGQNCQTYVGECARNPCQNGGTCSGAENNQGYTCKCPPGYSGQNCQINIDDCAIKPCKNSGRCVDRIGDYYCLCPKSYTGKNCQIFVATTAMLPTSSLSSTTPQTKKPEKPTQYSTTKKIPTTTQTPTTPRDIDECASNPCQNGGTCVDGNLRYTCQCPRRYGGQNCQIFVFDPLLLEGKPIHGKEGWTIWVEIPRSPPLPFNANMSWIKSGSPSRKGSGTLKIDKLKKEDAGKYIFSIIDPSSGSVTAVDPISIWVEVSLSTEFTIRILNRPYTEQLKNRSSTEYKGFEKLFKKEMDKVYKNFTGYTGVEIIKISKGSAVVHYRIRTTVVIKSSTQTTTGVQVNASQIIINNMKDGHIGKLQIDSRPEAVKIIAPPPPPENFRLLGVTKDGAKITWDRPKNSPYFFIKGYIIEYWKFGSESTKKTSDMFKDISIRLSGLESETSYNARVIAINDNGRGLESDNIEIKTEGKQFPTWAIAVIVAVILVIMVIMILVFICYRHRKKRIAAERHAMEMKRLDKIKESYPKSYFNLVTSFTISEKCTVFSRERLVLLYELGSGEFGVVYRGQLLDDDNEFIDCAVKTCKDKASDEDVRDLYQELDIMVNIGHHKNLVNVIGACEEPGKRKDRDKLYLLVEFAPHGSLFGYLKQYRENPREHHELELHYMNRLKLARHIAKGMAFLAKKRCVHRDLAARNVLLGNNFVAKVADFGLSRDIYETGQYEKTTSGKLPVRWMALESLEQRKFTLESDVWSFGVLLWEIETKGLLPHSALSFKDLVHKQKEGYRLEKPAGTPDKLYRLMGICWSADPKKRPTFSQLCNLLDVLQTEEKQGNRLSNVNSVASSKEEMGLESSGGQSTSSL